jgi:ElaA protein
MNELPTGYTLHRARLAELPGVTWHQISRLRQDVFIVEQHCPYPDQDARDAETTTEHLWVEGPASPDGPDHTLVVATLRLLTEPEAVARRIGRVATERRHRGRGLMGRLMREAIRLGGAAPVVLDAQAHLAGWYGSFGFVRDGDEFLEDGIPHVPMRRSPAQRR